ncbi:uracil-DNA glycosylase family protein [Nitratireductor sp. ZSWI3]|uniref:uracil-DNA glycosylase n=1 Tax=Nitratireductor sp. ZSWI3 TaxID=2966359 RepID=UPI00215062E1|nr:uracil-DNA glycosylase [Nitratireductor sp. ZSWI3]MCR4267460.1 uracil-DNA glycosylase [Nitratireductor sp. ZSWI3]
MDSAGLRELLTFYADAGVDEPLSETPANRFEETRIEAERRKESRPGADRTPAPAAKAQASPRAAPSAVVPDDAQAARAREIARGAETLEALREQLTAFDGCNLKTTAKNTVFADGNPAAPVMFVGEAPGRDEDIQGLPFVGRSGQLLDRMLTAIGLDRSSAYISNVIPWRPPGNRDPSPLETEICRPFIERHIELVAPKVLVTLGNPSTKLLLNTQTGIMRMRGNWAVHRTPSGLEIPTMPTLHPAYLLRNPAHKKLAWRDFLAIKLKLEGLGD